VVPEHYRSSKHVASMFLACSYHVPCIFVPPCCDPRNPSACGAAEVRSDPPQPSIGYRRREGCQGYTDLRGLHGRICTLAPDREPSPARSGRYRDMAIRSLAPPLQIRRRCEPGTARGPVAMPPGRGALFWPVFEAVGLNARRSPLPGCSRLNSPAARRPGSRRGRHHHPIEPQRGVGDGGIGYHRCAVGDLNGHVGQLLPGA
jgi:hypothetical protein